VAVEELSLHLQRNAFGPRETARAGDIWRLCQDAAVVGSSRRGWPPERYREVGAAFVVRSMVVVHHRPTMFGDRLTARTWVSSFRRDTLSDRQVRIDGPDGPIAGATQRWVHVQLPSLKPCRADAELVRSFGVVPDVDADCALPAVVAPEAGREHELRFEAWYTWMDPLAHANHPAYVDWADEATSRILVAAGLDPHALRPVAEEVTWRSGVVAPEVVTVRTSCVGRTEAGAVALSHRFEGAGGRLCAEATSVRTLLDADSEDLYAALR
jgi:acyl-CoA thioesterase FadM